MNKQMTMSLISDELRQAATPKKELIERMDRIIPWSRWTELVVPYYYKGNVNHLGRIRRCTSDCDSASSDGQTVDVEGYDQVL